MTHQPGPTSRQLFARGQTFIPGGVNSPVRAFGAVGGEPIFFAKGKGAFIEDVDGRRFIDYIGSWGPMIVGHANPEVVTAVQEAAAKSLSFGTPTEGEVDLAEKVCSIVPSCEKVRMVSSGTEACMSALRLARAATGRDRFVKFSGCYHGHADSFLVQAGSGAMTFGTPNSPGVPEDFVRLTSNLPFNDSDAIENFMAEHGDEVAAIIVEPIAGNMNFVPAQPEFLNKLRALCTRHQSVLIFDEVMTGFRVALGGAQSLYDIAPDLSCFGKVIGGGLAVGAFGGTAELMEQLAPLGSVYQAGTLSGNPVAVAAGATTLDIISRSGFFTQLEKQTATVCKALEEAAADAGVPLATDYRGGMFGFFFSEDNEITRFEQVKACDQARFKAFFHAMLDEGVYLAPSMFEAGFASIAHDAEVAEQTAQAAQRAFRRIVEPATA